MKEASILSLALIGSSAEADFDGQWNCPMAEEGERAGRRAEPGGAKSGCSPPTWPCPAPIRSRLRAGLRDHSVIWLSIPSRDHPHSAHPNPGNLFSSLLFSDAPRLPLHFCAGQSRPLSQAPYPYISTRWALPLEASNTTCPEFIFLSNQLFLSSPNPVMVLQSAKRPTPEACKSPQFFFPLPGPHPTLLSVIQYS